METKIFFKKCKGEQGTAIIDDEKGTIQFEGRGAKVNLAKMSDFFTWGPTSVFAGAISSLVLSNLQLQSKIILEDEEDSLSYQDAVMTPQELWYVKFALDFLSTAEA